MTEIVPISKVKGTKTITVCWQCKRGDQTLLRLKDDKGRKSLDYICRPCTEVYGMKLPRIGNSSKMKVEVYG